MLKTSFGLALAALATAATAQPLEFSGIGGETDALSSPQLNCDKSPFCKLVRTVLGGVPILSANAFLNTKTHRVRSIDIALSGHFDEELMRALTARYGKPALDADMTS